MLPQTERRVIIFRYRLLFHYFDRFLTEYESRLEKECCFIRTIIKKVIKRYLQCGNPRRGFARIRCQNCLAEHLLILSCRTHGFCPSCHAKKLEELGRVVEIGASPGCPHR
jgi:ribosomal protein S27E